VSRKTQRWSSREHETDAGAVESRQWIRLARELVEADETGARELGRRYMGEVARFSHGLVRRPGGHDYRQMIERIARIRGKRMPIVEVPVLTPRLSSLWLHLVTPVNASVARPLVEGLRTPTVARDDRIRALVPLEPMQFDDAVRAALAG